MPAAANTSATTAAEYLIHDSRATSLRRIAARPLHVLRIDVDISDRGRKPRMTE
jgi:hypothetical protein